MPLLFGLMLQAIGSTPPETIDLTVPQPCAAPAPADGEILVCAGRDGRGPYRIQPAPPAGSDVAKAETQLANGVNASVETESHDVGGFPSKRAMVRLKIRF